MAEAVTLAKLHPPGEVDRALAVAAVAGRFADNDLLRILTHHAGRNDRDGAAVAATVSRVSEDHSLQPGTSAWSGFGRNSRSAPDTPQPTGEPS